MDSNITRLIEMGFTREQAEVALEKTNNNPEQAIEYLFGGGTEEKHPGEAQMFDEDYNVNNDYNINSGTVAITNPQDIPQFPLLESQEYAYSSGWGTESEQLDLNECFLFQDPKAFLRNKESMPAVVPKLGNTPGRFVIPLYVILCQIPAFDRILLSKDLRQEWNETWFTDEPEEATSTQDENETYIAAIQRLIGFFTPASERSFISSEGFYNKVSETFKAHEFEDWDELLTILGKDLVKSLKLVLEHEFDLLDSHAVDQEGHIKIFKTVNIDSDCREPTLVDSICKLLWSPESYEIKSIAPILGIQVSPSESGRQAPSLKVEESFYPALFTSKYRPLVEQMDAKRIHSAKQRTIITSRIMSLSSFEGKKVRGFLDKAKIYMDQVGEKETYEDLTKLSESIRNESSQLNETLKKTNSEYAKLDTTNQDNTVEEIKKDDTLDIPSKYQLVGVVFSDLRYAYRTANNDWVLFLADAPNGVVIDFQSTRCTFGEVRSYVEDEPNDKFIFLVYADEGTLRDEQLELPPNLKSFFSKDNEFLHNQIEKAENGNVEITQIDDSSHEDVDRKDSDGEVKLDSTSEVKPDSASDLIDI